MELEQERYRKGMEIERARHREGMELEQERYREGMEIELAREQDLERECESVTYMQLLDVRLSQPDIVSGLLDEMGRDAHREFAAYVAAYHGDVATLESIKRDGVNLRMNNDELLVVASKCGHVDAAVMLAAHIETDINNKLMPLWHSYNGFYHALRHITAHADDMLVWNRGLYYAAEYGHLDMVARLADRGTSPDIWESSLVIAAEKGHLEIVKHLIPYCAPIRGLEHGAIRAAALEGNLAVVEYLCAALGRDTHADALALVNQAMETTQGILDDRLIDATRVGDLESVRDLVSKGASVDAGCSSPLLLAVTNGHLDVLKFLVGKGADVGQTLCNPYIELAARSGHSNIVMFLADAVRPPRSKRDTVRRLMNGLGKRRRSLLRQAIPQQK